MTQRIDRLADLGTQDVVLFLRVSNVEQSWTAKGDPYLTLRLSDVSRSLEAKIWHDRDHYEEAAELETGDVVKVLARLGSFQGRPQLEIKKLRPASDWADDDWDSATVFGPGYDRVKGLVAKTLVMDIETAPATDIRNLPVTIVEEITRVAQDREWDREKVLALNPLFSQVISIAIGGADKDGGWALFAPQSEDLGSLEQTAPSWMLPMSEREMLESFWTLSGLAEVIVTFNGRNFDLPFLRTRSAIHDVPAFVDLLSQPPYKVEPHMDLYQVLTNGGRGTPPMNLDAACYAFGIESPKNAMDGSLVAQAFREKRYEEIARYNLADIEATRRLYWRIKNNIVDYLV